jgi:translation initiation factor 3 subunit M
MLILILASLGFKNIGRDIPYTEIASALQIDVKDVEKWVIDGLSALSKLQ